MARSDAAPAPGATAPGGTAPRRPWPGGRAGWLLAALLLGLGFYGGWWSRSLPWFAAGKPAASSAPSERQQLLATGWREVDAGVFVRPCAGHCRQPRVYGGGAVEVLEVECLDRPCGQIRATFRVLGADGAPLDSLVVTAAGRQGERLQLVAETPNPQARRLVLQEFSARARLD
ncbi:MAG: hypothetical protein WCI65_06395 [Synechococcaceae cyanobacterium ELA263]